MKIVFTLIIALFYSFWCPAQENSNNFSQILQTYYLKTDRNIADKAIDFINNTTLEYNKLEPVLVGFFGAIFVVDKEIKNEFKSKNSNIKKSDFQMLFNALDTIPIDRIYLRTSPSANYNDMNWSSFFATGDTKYLDNIVKNVRYSGERNDITLFFAGASAKWSLCSNSKHHKLVKEYLSGLRTKNPAIEEILVKEPQAFGEETANIIKQQKAKGIWK